MELNEERAQAFRKRAKTVGQIIISIKDVKNHDCKIPAHEQMPADKRVRTISWKCEECKALWSYSGLLSDDGDNSKWKWHRETNASKRWKKKQLKKILKTAIENL